MSPDEERSLVEDETMRKCSDTHPDSTMRLRSLSRSFHEWVDMGYASLDNAPPTIVERQAENMGNDCFGSTCSSRRLIFNSWRNIDDYVEASSLGTSANDCVPRPVTSLPEELLHEAPFFMYPFWTTEEAADFVKSWLPHVLQNPCTTNGVARILELLGAHTSDGALRALLEACVHDDCQTVHRLAAGPAGDLNGTRACHRPLIIASACGNVRAVRALLEHGADPDLCDESGRSAVFHAAAASYIPTLVALLDAPAAALTLEMVAARLAHTGSPTLPDERRLAASMYVYQRLLEAETQLASEMATHGTGLRKMVSDSISANCFGESGGPGSLSLPAVSKLALETLTEPLSSGEEVDYFLCYAYADDADEQVAKLGPFLASAAPTGGTFWVCAACTPQWDITLKYLGVQGIRSMIVRSRKMILLNSEVLYKRYWAMEEVFLFVRLHGIGSLWIADTELHEASDVQPAQAALKRMPALSSFGSSGGIGRFNKTGLGIFAESDDE